MRSQMTALEMLSDIIFSSFIRKGLMLLPLCLSMAAYPVYASVVLHEDFETGQGDWSVDNGLWEIGTPTVDPKACHGGAGCAGTVLGGNYPVDTDSRLISPQMQLPNVSGEEGIYLRFWHWFSYSTNDAGYVQISTWNETTSTWSPWQSIGNAIVSESSVWTRRDVELTPYVGQKVRLAFFHTAAYPYESRGWYIDDIKVATKTLVFTGDFETGQGDWSVDNGLWEIGTPTVNPKACHGGAGCAGTVLGGNYPVDTDSRLISPPIWLLKGSEDMYLRFWHWFSYSTNDAGYVQISTWNETTSTWSPWQSIGNAIVSESSVWTRRDVELTPYVGQKVRLAFFHTAAYPYESRGWYIDDIEITGIQLSPLPPSLTLLLTGCNPCKAGDRFSVQAHVTNPTSKHITVEVKVGVRLPDGTPINLLDKHLTVTLPAGLDTTVSRLLDFTMPGGLPPGSWTVEGRLLEPELGTTLSEDVTLFVVQ